MIGEVHCRDNCKKVFWSCDSRSLILEQDGQVMLGEQFSPLVSSSQRWEGPVEGGFDLTYSFLSLFLQSKSIGGNAKYRV